MEAPKMEELKVEARKKKEPLPHMLGNRKMRRKMEAMMRKQKGFR